MSLRTLNQRIYKKSHEMFFVFIQMAGKYPILLDKNQLHRNFLSVLISIEAFYLVENQNQEIFKNFFRRFRKRENM